MFPQWQYDLPCVIIWSNWNSLQKQCRGLCLYATRPNKKTPNLYWPVSSSGSQTSSRCFCTTSLSTDFFFFFSLLLSTTRTTTSMVVTLMPFHPCWHAVLFFPILLSTFYLFIPSFSVVAILTLSGTTHWADSQHRPDLFKRVFSQELSVFLFLRTAKG